MRTETSGRPETEGEVGSTSLTSPAMIGQRRDGSSVPNHKSLSLESHIRRIGISVVTGRGPTYAIELLDVMVHARVV